MAAAVAKAQPARHATQLEDGLVRRSALHEAVVSLACTSTSCCVADGLCLPLDFLKTRLQLQNELVKTSTAQQRLGPLGMVQNVLRTEGALAFYDGLPAAMLRQATYGGLCFASYPYLRNFFADAVGTSPQDAPIWARVAAGAIAGGSASAIANPTDVIKVRVQADGRNKLRGEAPRYTGCWDAAGTIWRAEGPSTFYRGVLPNVQRACAVNGAGIAAYDQAKQTARSLLGEEESLTARTVAAMVGGVVTALVGCPFDVLKTRLMNQNPSRPLYAGPADAFLQIVRVEGPLALYKGLLPVYFRQAPFNILNYLIMEQLTATFLGRTM